MSARLKDQLHGNLSFSKSLMMYKVRTVRNQWLQ
jgi:hypothetical protein